MVTDFRTHSENAPVQLLAAEPEQCIDVAGQNGQIFTCTSLLRAVKKFIIPPKNISCILQQTITKAKEKNKPGGDNRVEKAGSVALLGLAIFLFYLSSGFGQNKAYANDDLQQKMNDPANWVSWGGDYQGTRYSKLDQINTSNVHKLQLKWMAPLRVTGNYESTPLVVGNRIYLYIPYVDRVIALDQDSQQITWVYKQKDEKAEIKKIVDLLRDDASRAGFKFHPSSHGLAYGHGKIFLYQVDATLVALDAQTGKEIWQVNNLDSDMQRLANNAPVVVNDKVIVGISGGGKVQQRGYLTAYHINNGKRLWRAYSTGPDKDLLVDPVKTQTWSGGKLQSVGKNSSLKSWQGQQWQQGGGFTSGWITVDKERNLLYYGTGAPKPWDPRKRPGDNRWTSALWARDIDTGIAKWVYQLTPHDEWGYDAVNESILIDRQVGNTTLPELWHFDANGFVYRLNRESGALLSANKVHNSVNWAKAIDLNSGRPKLDSAFSTEKAGREKSSKICPSLYSIHNLQAAAYSPGQQLLYSAGNHLCTQKGSDYFQFTFSREKVERSRISRIISREKKKRYDTINIKGYPHSILAWDVEKQQIRWQHREAAQGENAQADSVSSGILATAGDLVFYGTRQGLFIASHAKTGKVLYRIKTPSGIVSNPVSWRYKGKQYIGLIAGHLRPRERDANIPDCIGTVHGYYLNPPLAKKAVHFRNTLCRQTQQGFLLVFSLPELLVNKE